MHFVFLLKFCDCMWMFWIWALSLRVWNYDQRQSPKNGIYIFKKLSAFSETESERFFFIKQRQSMSALNLIEHMLSLAAGKRRVYSHLYLQLTVTSKWSMDQLVKLHAQLAAQAISAELISGPLAEAAAAGLALLASWRSLEPGMKLVTFSIFLISSY